MKPCYEITMKIRTTTGLADIGLFSLGTDLDFALTVFDSFKGERNDNHNAIIHLCLVEKSGKLPPKELKSIGCILNEFAENSKIIARDVFKFLNLENNHFQL